ncbi:hypothetical protein CWI38_1181p0020 [Hamiltosporidium tvaerminnensis]|uniref:Uncharacterized protein n=2 Tax=Hamiltosporidium TaxID=1176354 RepID=A0A4Q9KZW2_9MICR|nr:hypothetical protein LUQ84_002304 [Hamiltosporidium tvaerminnensis]TBT98582.1 hypothetical protein CWI37_1689p0020 [Hamiltosporidium tvaerminnensis]TBU00529.1 hypothetical protein CWI36_1610p0010 [Hamiltosporidium magnivora]TBU00593.1 hypothetical protein CWI39_1635p0020 [Hamiltosporidium magnivora]TBU11489.1 hypothetical protein CWI38_1181p0020 [Hamiltosporidium tvaerminnensis]
MEKEEKIDLKKYKISGKIITNGGYIVLKGELCICITTSCGLYIERSIYKSVKPTILIKTEFTDYLYAEYNGKEFIPISINGNPSLYFLRIINLFYNLTKKIPENSIFYEMKFDEGFFVTKGRFIEESIKTGLGSSACYLVGIVFGLVDYDLSKIHNLSKLCYDINKIMNPKASGCDVVCCVEGSLIYSPLTYKPFKGKMAKIVLGSFGSSTSTREMINKEEIINADWNRVININNVILDRLNFTAQEYSDYSGLKDLYFKYLVALRHLSDKIVPNRQYKALMDTSDMNIYGCGVSGSGGEDCTWCLVPESSVNDIVQTWKKTFKYVHVVDLNQGPGIKIIE